jgi:hypothetical protein
LWFLIHQIDKIIVVIISLVNVLLILNNLRGAFKSRSGQGRQSHPNHTIQYIDIQVVPVSQGIAYLVQIQLQLLHVLDVKVLDALEEYLGVAIALQ